MVARVEVGTFLAILRHLWTFVNDDVQADAVYGGVAEGVFYLLTSAENCGTVALTTKLKANGDDGDE